MSEGLSEDMRLVNLLRWVAYRLDPLDARESDREETHDDDGVPYIMPLGDGNRQIRAVAQSDERATARSRRLAGL